MIRVGHVIHAFTSGGMERGLLNLVNHGSAHLKHVIVCLTSADALATEIRSNTCEVVELRKSSGNDWRVPGRIATVAKRARLNVLHARGWPTLVETALGAALAGIGATVYSFHGRTLEDLGGVSRRRQWAQRLVVPRYRRVVALNQRMRCELASECRMPEERIAVIANGVDTDRFRPLGEKEALRRRLGLPIDRLVIGNVARLDPVKNHHLLLRAVRRCVSEGLRPFVLLVGDGPHRAVIEAEVAQLGLGPDVSIRGHSRDVPQLLNTMDVYVQASFYEGFSNTVLEAMACGLPIMATNVGGTADLFSHGVEGWLFESDCESALASLIEIAARDRVGIGLLGARGRQRVLAQYSLTTMVANYESMYTSLAAISPRTTQCREYSA